MWLQRFLSIEIDGRWGMLSPVVIYNKIEMPAFITKETTTTRTVQLEDEGNPLTLTNQTDTITTNGKIYTNVLTYDRNNNTGSITVTTPENRTSISFFDRLGRLTESYYASLNGNKLSYDSYGRISKIEQLTNGSSLTTTIAYNLSTGYPGEPIPGY